MAYPASLDNLSNVTTGQTITAAIENSQMAAINAIEATLGVNPQGAFSTVAAAIAGALSGAMPAGGILPFAGVSTPSGWLLCDGSSVSRSTYASLYAALVADKGTCTITIASPAVVTCNAHGLVNGDAVFFETTGALPTGLTADTTYFVINVTTNTFQVSATRNGTAINTTGSQSGVHSLFFAPYGVSAATTFKLPDMRGRAPFGKDNMGGSAASRLTGSVTGGVNGAILGNSGGEQAHQLTQSELASHSHTPGTLGANHSHSAGSLVNSAHSHYANNGIRIINIDQGTSYVMDVTGNSLKYTDGGAPITDSQTPTISGSTQSVNPTFTGSTGSTGSDVAHNTVPPALVINYLIKT
jgi:microcystin-dependent protein